MQKNCLKCGHIGEVPNDPLAECPSCGAIYSKVQAAIEAREKAEREASEKAEAQRVAHEKAKADAQAASLAYAARTEAAKHEALLRKGVVCSHCGTLGPRRLRTRGTLGLEIGLWVVGLVTLLFGIGLLILPAALIYSIWRMFSRRVECTACGSPNVIPASSPAAQRILQQSGPKP